MGVSANPMPHAATAVGDCSAAVTVSAKRRAEARIGADTITTIGDI